MRPSDTHDSFANIEKIRQSDSSEIHGDEARETHTTESGQKVKLEYSKHFMNRVNDVDERTGAPLPKNQKRMVNQRGEPLNHSVVKRHISKSIDHILANPELHPSPIEKMKKVVVIGKKTGIKTIFHLHNDGKGKPPRIHVATFLNHAQDVDDFDKSYTRTGKKQVPGVKAMIESMILENMFKNQWYTVVLDI